MSSTSGCGAVVAHPLWERGVASSNLATPTNIDPNLGPASCWVLVFKFLTTTGHKNDLINSSAHHPPIHPSTGLLPRDVGVTALKPTRHLDQSTSPEASQNRTLLHPWKTEKFKDYRDLTPVYYPLIGVALDACFRCDRVCEILPSL